MTRKFILFQFCLLLGGLAIIELVFGNWISGSRINMVQVIRDVHFVYPATDKEEERHYIRDRWGLRGKYSDPSQIDILTLGASTTDQRYITEGKTWQDVLANCLTETSHRPVSVVNAGIDGNSIYGFLEAFQVWFPEIPNLHPKYTLVYTGVIDYDVLDKMGLKPHIPIKRRFNLVDRLVKKSALYRVYQIVLNRWQHKPTYVDYDQKRLVVQLERKPVAEVEKDPNLDREFVKEEVFSLFRGRLKEMETAIREFGSAPIFVTQKTFTYKVEGENILSYRGREGFGHYKRWKRMSSVVLDFCKESGSYCVDLANEIPFELEDFKDDSHNSVLGTRKIGKYLCEKLNPLFNGRESLVSIQRP